MRNLHKAYYKDYFENLDFSYLLNNSEGPKAEIMRRNASLTASNLLQQIPKSSLVNQTFELKIAYPGLVTGVGINHETKIEGEFKLGVHFDWSHGMPVVYGSSVKGVLKSAFKDGYVDKSLVNRANEKVNNNSEKVPEWVGDKANKDIIIRGIFEGKDVEGKNLSIYNRDVFFDAVIIEPDSQRRILCSDSITPHGDNPLKNPTPLTFLKIAPGCKLEFRFKLTNSDFGEEKTLTAAQKKTLFVEILKTVGVGAKTNVGYGQLKEPEIRSVTSTQEEQNEDASESLQAKQNKPQQRTELKNEEYTGKIILIPGVGYQVRLDDARYNNIKYPLSFNQESDKNKLKKKSDKVKVIVTISNNKIKKVTFKESI